MKQAEGDLEDICQYFIKKKKREQKKRRKKDE